MLALLLLLPPGINCKRKIAVFPPRPEQQAQDESVPRHSPLTGGDLVALFACVKQSNQLFHGANSLEKSSFRALVALFRSELLCSPPSNRATKRLACVGLACLAHFATSSGMVASSSISACQTKPTHATRLVALLDGGEQRNSESNNATSARKLLFFKLFAL